ncbi:hypothetical protein B9G69_008605 [Bdellovibrio sp. SKB1291214]|uniref:hypothetical protein n=1 Tax=Bdellovibrio sp. SKB1291214 TaxID=1732569 RepID=UPI000B51C018|nr:hypothetical protein [Bdellovibrio sp. SKB1291214]UYL10634.1 hypothetical protein B9G69_008605 [Bdellovibrio sp. SKB1291214]
MHKLLIIFAFFINSVALAEPANCDKAADSLRALNTEIFGDQSEFVDMTPKVNAAIKIVDECKFDLRKIGVPDSIYKDALANNRRDEITRQKFILSLYATSGKIDAKLEAFKKYMATGKDLNPDKTQKYIDDVKRQAEQSYAEESKTCTAVDLRDKTGPVRNQGMDGWCYAFTVANLVSWKTGKDISAAAVAFGYSDNGYHDIYRMLGANQDFITNQGFTTAAFRASKSKGFCLESELPSEGFNGIETNVPLAVLDKMGKDVISGKISQEDLNKLAAKAFPNLTKEQIGQVLERASKSTYFNKLVRKSCKHRVSAEGMEMSFFNNFDAKKFGKELDQHLNESRPVEIGYNGHFFTHPYTPSGLAYHSSLLVGRRMNKKTGQCEYLLKNSYGKDWKPAASDEFESEGGYAWVPKARMIEATRNASYVK